MKQEITRTLRYRAVVKEVNDTMCMTNLAHGCIELILVPRRSRDIYTDVSNSNSISSSEPMQISQHI